MSERCEFVETCPMMADITELSGVCQEERGSVCGPVAAYGVLVFEMEGLALEDVRNPIVGSFEFTAVPDGDPPIEVRQEWLGVKVPVRHPDAIQEGFVDVSSADARLSLLSHGRLEAASWFTALEMTMGSFTATFRSSEGSYSQTEAISSGNYYGSNIDPETRVTIEQS